MDVFIFWTISKGWKLRPGMYFDYIEDDQRHGGFNIQVISPEGSWCGFVPFGFRDFRDGKGLKMGLKVFET